MMPAHLARIYLSEKNNNVPKDYLLELASDEATKVIKSYLMDELLKVHAPAQSFKINLTTLHHLCITSCMHFDTDILYIHLRHLLLPLGYKTLRNASNENIVKVFWRAYGRFRLVPTQIE